MTPGIEDLRRRRANSKKPVNAKFAFRINRHAEFLKAKAEEGARNRETVAEDMAEHGGTCADVARRTGININTVRRHWAAIRAELGWQAV